MEMGQFFSPSQKESPANGMPAQGSLKEPFLTLLLLSPAQFSNCYAENVS